MLPINGWIQKCYICVRPTSHKVIFILQDFTTHMCKKCAPLGTQFNPHLRFCTLRIKTPERTPERTPELQLKVIDV